MVQSEFYDATRIFLYAKKIKIMTFFQQFGTFLSLLVSVALFCILPNPCTEADTEGLRCMRPMGNIQNGATLVIAEDILAMRFILF